MARLLIDVACDDDTFQDSQGEFAPEPELAFILIHLVAKITSWGSIGDQPIELRDSKGTLVGSARLVTSRALGPLPWLPKEDATAPPKDADVAVLVFKKPLVVGQTEPGIDHNHPNPANSTTSL
jgi:hypothetical protein